MPPLLTFSIGSTLITIILIYRALNPYGPSSLETEEDKDIYKALTNNHHYTQLDRVKTTETKYAAVKLKVKYNPDIIDSLKTQIKTQKRMGHLLPIDLAKMTRDRKR
jgi:hypothetical protein